MNLTRAMKIAQTGFDVWAAKPHNKRWAKMIDGTPIPNDLPVCIAHEFALVLGLEEARPAPVVDREAAWLIEWPANRQMPVRYWHPTEGHVLDANDAVRFCRREDAEAMLKRDHLFGGAKAVEHIWTALLSPTNPQEHDDGR